MTQFDKFKYIFLSIILISCLSIFYYSTKENENEIKFEPTTENALVPTIVSNLNIDRYRMVYDDVIKPDNQKYVLLYTGFFGSPSWYDAETLGEDRLKAGGCSYTNCIITSNKTLLPHLHDYDALVFHSNVEDRKDVPEIRSPHQVYVMALKESPFGLEHILDRDRGFFNWTMTYRLDSDVQWFYGKIVDKLTDGIVAPAVDVKWREPDYDFHDDEILQIVKNKTKSAAWFVSNCGTHSKRENLVEKLQKFIDVDVYGACGPLKCTRKSVDCDQMLNTTYRFYLAFENSLCVDYLTEKLYVNMQQFVIPVVYSGVELSHFLPPKSYIDANKFETVEDLANFLKFLGNNPEEYVKYFWWREYFKILPEITPPIDFMCDFCEKLNEPNFVSKTQIYEDMTKWYQEGACTGPKIKF